MKEEEDDDDDDDENEPCACTRPAARNAASIDAATAERVKEDLARGRASVSSVETSSGRRARRRPNASEDNSRILCEKEKEE